MAKLKQKEHVAAQHAQGHQQRPQHDARHVSGPQNRKHSSKGRRIRKKDRSGLYLALGSLGLIAALLAVFFFVARPLAATNAPAQPTPADQTVVQQVIGVSQSTWETVGTGGQAKPFQTPLSNQPSLAGSTGHPQFLYIGAEWCPGCAAERWAIINALSRFGTFSNLKQIQSGETGATVSTFTFEGSSYASQYVEFVPRELFSNNKDSTGNYIAQDTLTVPEQQIFSKYQGYPFIDIGNTYVLAQATYTPQVLQDSARNPLSWQEIASALSNPQSPIAQGILGSANYLTAAICTLTKQQPGTLCQAPVIQQIEHQIDPEASIQSGQMPTRVLANLRSTQRRRSGEAKGTGK